MPPSPRTRLRPTPGRRRRVSTPHQRCRTCARRRHGLLPATLTRAPAAHGRCCNKPALWVRCLLCPPCPRLSVTRAGCHRQSPTGPWSAQGVSCGLRADHGSSRAGLGPSGGQTFTHLWQAPLGPHFLPAAPGLPASATATCSLTATRTIPTRFSRYRGLYETAFCCAQISGSILIHPRADALLPELRSGTAGPSPEGSQHGLGTPPARHCLALLTLSGGLPVQGQGPVGAGDTAWQPPGGDPPGRPAGRRWG